MDSPPFGAPWAPHEHTKTNGTSVFALTASLLGFVCFMGVGGVLGVILGLIARGEIARSEGRQGGRGLATAAIVIGTLNVCVTVIGFAVGVAYLANQKPRSASRSAPAVTAPAWAPHAAAPHAPKPATPAARASREGGGQVTTLGTITLADISGDLEAELDKQRRAASASGETLVLWLTVAGADCKPCAGVAAALTSPIAQKALAKVRFVRVDRDEFQVELERLGIPTEKIPGFALLDAHNHPLDFIHGGEWDADIAANIAPVLGKFVHGSYPQRRHPWHGAAREDETPI